MFTVDSHCILFVKWLKRDRGRAVCSGVSKSEPQCGLKGAVTPELDHWHQLHNHARSSCSVNSTKYSSIHLHVTDNGKSVAVLDPYENLRDGLVLGMAAFGIWVIQCSAVMCAQSASCYASLILIKSFEDEGKDKESGIPMTCYKSSKAWAAPLMYTLVFGYHSVNVLIINPEDIVEFDATICHICHRICVRNFLCFPFFCSA